MVPDQTSRAPVLAEGWRFAIASQGRQTTIEEFELTEGVEAVRRRRIELPHDAFDSLTLLPSGTWLYGASGLVLHNDTGDQLLHWPQGTAPLVHVLHSNTGPQGRLLATLADGSVVALQIDGQSVVPQRLLPPRAATPFLLDGRGDQVAVAYVAADYKVELFLVPKAGNQPLHIVLPWTPNLANADQHTLRLTESALLIGDRQRLAAYDVASGTPVFVRA